MTSSFLNEKRQKALSMTYGYFLGGGCGRSDRTQVALTYTNSTLTQDEIIDVIKLMKKEEYARRYYFDCLNIGNLVI